MRSRQLMLPGALVAAVAVAGCGEDSGDDSKKSSASTTPEPKVQKIAVPKIGVAFKEPAPNASLADKVTAVVSLSNFTLDPKNDGKAPQLGKGQLHFTMDGGKFDFPRYSGANGKLAKELGVAGKYSPSLMPMITYKGLPKGKHTLKVNLANNDRSDAGASAMVTFNVK